MARMIASHPSERRRQPPPEKRSTRNACARRLRAAAAAAVSRHRRPCFSPVIYRDAGARPLLHATREVPGAETQHYLYARSPAPPRGCRCRTASLPHACRRGHGRGTNFAWRCCHFSEAARTRSSSSGASMRCRRRSTSARASPARGGACACASPSPSRWSRCRRDLRSASTPSDQTGLRR